MTMAELDFKAHDLTIVCPHCGKETGITAEAYQMDHCRMPVCIWGGDACLDWDSIDFEGEFGYYCDQCSEKVCDTLDELGGKIKSGEIRKCGD